MIVSGSRIFLVIFLVGLFGCGTLPFYTSKNIQKSSYSCRTSMDLQQTHSKPEVKCDLSGSSKQFVGVSLSGGGVRASIFSAAILENLEKEKAFNLSKSPITAISSVSGGSLTSAYYGLFHDCDRAKDKEPRCRKPKQEKKAAGSEGSDVGNKGVKDWWEEYIDILSDGFQGRLLFKLLSPHNLLLQGFTHFDRSDLMAEVFDEKLFYDKQFSFLEKSEGPRIYINATHVAGSYANKQNRFKRRTVPFTFNQENFDQLSSDLSPFPISKAVMASAAFPGGFNNVTLRDHENSTYAHFLDGGPSGNLGIIPLLETFSLQKEFEKETKNSGFPRMKCKIFVVDASIAGTYDWEALGVGGYEFGWNKVLKKILRKAENAAGKNKCFMGENVEGDNRENEKNCGELLRREIKSLIEGDPKDREVRKSLVDVPDTRSWFDFVVDSNFGDAIDRMLLNTRIRNLLQLGLDVRVSPFQPWTNDALQKQYSALKKIRGRSRKECKGWHFSFNRLLGLAAATPEGQSGKGYGEKLFDKESEIKKPEMSRKDYVDLWRKVVSIKTRFDLVGENENDSPEVLRRALEITAKILVKDYFDTIDNGRALSLKVEPVPVSISSNASSSKE
jgi:predicted acylesterase/phospholipase RssA